MFELTYEDSYASSIAAETWYIDTLCFYFIPNKTSRLLFCCGGFNKEAVHLLGENAEVLKYNLL